MPLSAFHCLEPLHIQSLAGNVFNEVAQFGNSVGLAVTAAIAASVTEHSTSNPTDASLKGYCAAFWTIFGATATVVVVIFFSTQEGRSCREEEDKNAM